MSESVKSTVFGIKRSSLSKIIDFTSSMRRFYGFVLSVTKLGIFGFSSESGTGGTVLFLGQDWVKDHLRVKTLFNEPKYIGIGVLEPFRICYSN
jgi:hypothetical protein